MSLLTLADAFRLFEGLPSTEEWSMLIVVADQDRCWLVSSDGTKCTVTTAAAQPKKGRPSAAVTLWYKTTDLATRDFRAEISEANWMKLYTRGQLRFYGSMAQGKKLEEPFKAMLARHVAEGGTAPALASLTTAAAAPIPADAAAPLESGYVPLVEEAVAEAKAESLDDALSGYEEPAAAQPWWRVEFGTDMLLGGWLTQLGCLVYLGVLLQIVVKEPNRLDKWLEVLAAAIFIVGCHYLIQGSHPSSLAKMLEKFAAMPAALPPPGATATYLERHVLQTDTASFLGWYVTGSDLMLSTTLFNIGMVPFLLEGMLNMAYPPKDDPPGAAASLFFGTLLIFPALIYLNKTTSVDAFRGQSRSGGGSRAWDGCLRACVLRLAGEEGLPYWERHVGLDGLLGAWVYFYLMLLSLVGVVPAWLYDPDDSMQLCGVSMSCAANVYMLVPFTAGAYLFVRSMYPEHANGSILFPEADPDADEEAADASEPPNEPWHRLQSMVTEGCSAAGALVSALRGSWSRHAPPETAHQPIAATPGPLSA